MVGGGEGLNGNEVGVGEALLPDGWVRAGLTEFEVRAGPAVAELADTRESGPVEGRGGALRREREGDALHGCSNSRLRYFKIIQGLLIKNKLTLKWQNLRGSTADHDRQAACEAARTLHSSLPHDEYPL